ncbi:MAG: leucyl aminopeptidase [Pseudonocardiales bacterium]|jgi:leucyl aminopeptidase|nr:leucyl aminopeptidase [Pseudonocardiales bacterium]
MPSVTVKAPAAPIRADAVVVGVRKTKDGPQLVSGAEPVDTALGGRLVEALRTLGATGRPDEVLKVPTLGLADFPLVVGTGLGEDATSAEAARRAAGAALRALTGQRRVHLAIDAAAGALAEGALLGAYAFTSYKSSPTEPALRTITIAGPTSSRADVRRATIVADAVSLTRDLVNTPPNDLYPETFAARAAELAKERGLTVEVLDERALKRGKFGGILAVGAGSVRSPRLVRISYRPAKPKAHLALVGKGITFDSGGINLKTANLTWMKSDMGGAAAVIASALAIAALKLPVSVTVTVPMAENMPSGTSYRPSDILRMYDGSTVEVGDTDAEGRLVLADAITRAVEDEPDYLMELSTLTGAQLVALGPRLIGVMGEERWRREVVAAADTAGEGAWGMPLPAELRAGLDSPVADLVNVPSDRWGGMLVAGRFLGEFVPDGLPWAHLDIAGPAFNQGGARDYTPKGGTGAGVRTIIAAAERLSAG